MLYPSTIFLYCSFASLGALMQKYLMGKDDSEADKEFYKLLKEWEESKTRE